MRALGRLAPWLIAGSVLACLDPTQATLVITTNVDCGPEEHADGTLFETGLSAAATANATAQALATTTTACTPRDSGIHDIGELVIYPEGDTTDASVIVVGALDTGVTAEDCLALARREGDADNAQRCIIARRTVGFATHKSLEVPILLDRLCAGVLCDDGTTCVSVAGATSCVDDRVSCRGEACSLENTGGGATGGGGAGGGDGGGGAGPAALDCSALEALYEPMSGGPQLETIAGVEGYYADRPYLAVTASQAPTFSLNELDGGVLVPTWPLASAAVGLDVASFSSSLRFTVAEEDGVELFDQDFWIVTATGQPHSDVVFDATGTVAFAITGPKLSRLQQTSFSTETSFMTPQGGPTLSALSRAADRVFATGSHVCFRDLGVMSNSCGAPLVEPWVDVWAESTSKLVGIGADFVDVTNEAGALIGPHDVLPQAAAGVLSLRKVRGSAANSPRYFVAGGLTDGSGETTAYVARGTPLASSIDWEECVLPGASGIVDLWVTSDGGQLYFVTDAGAAYRLPASP